MIEVPDLERFPDKGDILEVHTLAGIGSVTSSWELVEFEHSRTFSALMQRVDGGLIPFYGEKGGIFRDRFNLLKIAMDHRFIVQPDQALEARFDRMSEVTGRFAAKRNDIAHSVVFDLTNVFFLKNASPSQQQNFYAIPPLYALSKRSSDGTLPFAYTSRQLGTLASGMLELQMEWRKLRHHLFPDEWPEEQRAP